MKLAATVQLKRALGSDIRAHVSLATHNGSLRENGAVVSPDLRPIGQNVSVPVGASDLENVPPADRLSNPGSIDHVTLGSCRRKDIASLPFDFPDFCGCEGAETHGCVLTIQGLNDRLHRFLLESEYRTGIRL